MKDKLEAILFAAGRYVDEEFIARLLGEDIRRVRKALSELKADFDRRANETALQVVQEDKSWKLHVQDKYLDIVSKLVSDKEIAKTVLETLAICAWKNPITQAELIKYRGPAAYEHVGELIERGFLTKQPEGRSFKLNITDKFFEYFDVEGRDDIRKLFKQVEDKAIAEQSEVDQKKAAYDAQKILAEATAKALAEGKEPPTAESLGLTMARVTDSEHSAKNDLKNLLDETKAELEKFQETVQEESESIKHMQQPVEDEEEQKEENEQETPPGEEHLSTAELIKETREELAEFSEDLDKMKTEQLKKAQQAATKPHHTVKHVKTHTKERNEHSKKSAHTTKKHK